MSVAYCYCLHSAYAAVHRTPISESFWLNSKYKLRQPEENGGFFLIMWYVYKHSYTVQMMNSSCWICLFMSHKGHLFIFKSIYKSASSLLAVVPSVRMSLSVSCATQVTARLPLLFPCQPEQFSSANCWTLIAKLLCLCAKIMQH